MLTAEQTEQVMKAMQSLRMAAADITAAYNAECQVCRTADTPALEPMYDALTDCLAACEQAQTDLVPAEL